MIRDGKTSKTGLNSELGCKKSSNFNLVSFCCRAVVLNVVTIYGVFSLNHLQVGVCSVFVCLPAAGITLCLGGNALYRIKAEVFLIRLMCCMCTMHHALCDYDGLNDPRVVFALKQTKNNGKNAKK